jgi:hypothetical protein
MGLGGAILAEQSACVFRRASQHTIQWAWAWEMGGEICSFLPQGRRTARVSKIRNREGERTEGWGGRKDCHNPFHNAHTIPPRAWEGRDEVYNAPEPLVSWTILFPRARTGNPQQGRETQSDISPKPLPSEMQSFFLIPPHPSPGNIELY